MDASIAPGDDWGRVSRLLVPWLCLGASSGFLAWVIFSGPGEMQQVLVGLRRYLLFVPAGFAAAGAVCVLCWFRGAGGVAARLSYVSCIFYFGFLKVLGWSFVPWALIVVAIIGFSRSNELSIETRWSLLLLHVTGTLAGLYMAFHLNDFLYPWEPFKDVVRSLWLLTIELISRLL